MNNIYYYLSNAYDNNHYEIDKPFQAFLTYFLGKPIDLFALGKFVGKELYEVSDLIEPKNRGFLRNLEGIFINGFSDDKRTYGWVKCFPGIINNKLDCAVIFLERTIHPRNVIEVISRHYLRKELNLKDGDVVEILITTK